IAAVIQATGLAAASIAEIVEGLTVDTDRMQQNIDSTQGTIYAERAMILLAPAIGRDRAHLLLEEAARLAVTQKRSLSDVLADMAEVTKHLDRAVLQQLSDAESYLGSAERFRERLLQLTPTSAKKE